MNGNMATLEKDMPNVACISGIKAWARLSQGEPNFGNRLTTLGITCRTPTLAKCGGEAQHLEKLGLGVLRDSRMFRARQQGAKHLALRCSWCHWKVLET
jgi:hypothetical protein